MAIFALQKLRSISHSVPAAGFYMVAGARFELTGWIVSNLKPPIGDWRDWESPTRPSRQHRCFADLGDALLVHLEEQQIGNLADIGLIGHALIAQHMREIPDLGDEGLRVHDLEMPHVKLSVPTVIQILNDEAAVAMVWCCFRTQKARALELFRPEFVFDASLIHEVEETFLIHGPITLFLL